MVEAKIIIIHINCMCFPNVHNNSSMLYILDIKQF